MAWADVLRRDEKHVSWLCALWSPHSIPVQIDNVTNYILCDRNLVSNNSKRISISKPFSSSPTASSKLSQKGLGCDRRGSRSIMADSASLLASHAHKGKDIYAQRMIPESSALLAMFRGRQPPAKSVNLGLNTPTTTASCLRKISAYTGGYHLPTSQIDSFGTDSGHERSVNGASRVAKKRLSFADQHGGQLVRRCFVLTVRPT